MRRSEQQPRRVFLQWTVVLAWYVIPSDHGEAIDRRCSTAVSAGNPLDDIPALDRLVREISATESDAEVLGDLCSASAMAIPQER